MKNLLKGVLESPYAGDIRGNRIFAENVARHLLVTKGWNLFASHIYYPHFLNEHLSSERELGIEAGLQWTRDVKDLLVVMALPTYILWPSDGMERAHARHQAACRQIMYGIFDITPTGGVENRHWLTCDQFFHHLGWIEGIKQTPLRREAIDA